MNKTGVIAPRAIGNGMTDKPLGLVAGGGALPLRIAEAVQRSGRDVFVLGLANEADEGIQAFDHDWTQIGHMAGAVDKLLAANCHEVVIIGGIQRPNLAEMDFDEGGEWFMREAASGKHTGDDQLLKIILAYFQMRGLDVQPAQKYLAALTGLAGAQTAQGHAAHQADIDRGIEVAQVIGGEDIGQSVVIADRLVLAVEGPEGTDNMLARVASMATEFLGTKDAPKGVLVKLPKPQQDRRVDLPTIGLRTIDGVANANLAGIVYEAGGALFADFDAVVAAADEKGLFLYGLEPHGGQ